MERSLYKRALQLGVLLLYLRVGGGVNQLGMHMFACMRMLILQMSKSELSAWPRLTVRQWITIPCLHQGTSYPLKKIFVCSLSCWSAANHLLQPNLASHGQCDSNQWAFLLQPWQVSLPPQQYSSATVVHTPWCWPGASHQCHFHWTSGYHWACVVWLQQWLCQ